MDLLKEFRLRILLIKTSVPLWFDVPNLNLGMKEDAAIPSADFGITARKSDLFRVGVILHYAQVI